MKDFDFTLKFSFSEKNTQAEEYVEMLAEAGCDDAIIGIGQSGRIALQFNREADNAVEAILSAIRDIKSVIPDAKLVEATPDLVGISDIAKLLGFSRQNMRKLVFTHRPTFPTPVHEGSASIWHLAKVLMWFEHGQRKKVEPSLLEVATATMQLNIAKESADLDPKFRSKIAAFAI